MVGAAARLQLEAVLLLLSALVDVDEGDLAEACITNVKTLGHTQLSVVIEQVVVK